MPRGMQPRGFLLQETGNILRLTGTILFDFSSVRRNNAWMS
jgi:hypothetical protein